VAGEHPGVDAAGRRIRVRGEDEDPDARPVAHDLEDQARVERGAVHRRPIAERHEEKRIAGRPGLDGRAGPEVGFGEAERPRHGIPILERRTEGRGPVLHPDEGRSRQAAFELDWNRPDLLLEDETRRVRRRHPVRGQHPRGTDGRMSREGQLARGREDPERGDTIRARRGEEKDRLREVHLAGDLLHDRVVESAAIQKNRERVATEHAVGEHIDLHEPVRPRRHGGRVAYRKRVALTVSPTVNMRKAC
jgi:hypothetical protein